MIERLLAAERALAEGELDQAERLYAQVAEADERNAMAVVGLAAVALARGDLAKAAALATRALAIDPQDAAAGRVLDSAPTSPAAVVPPAADVPPAAVVPPVAVVPPRPAGGLRAWLRRLLGRAG